MVRRFSFKLLLVFVLFFLVLSFVSAVDFYRNDTVVINQSGLPDNGFVSLNVTNFPVNNSLSVVNLSGAVDFFNFSFPDSFYFDVSNSSVVFNYSVDNFVFVGNRSEVFSFLLNNSFYNISIFYDVYFDLVDDLVNNNIRFYDLYVTRDGSRMINITSNLLPFNERYQYTLKGLFNQTVNVSCDSWLDCPVNVTFGLDNTVSFFVNLSIPHGVVNGSYVRTVSFFGFNGTVRNSTFDINVVHPNFLFASYDWSPECFILEGKAVTIECMREYEKFKSDQDIAKWDYALSLQPSTCENITIVEYVMAGSIEDDIKSAYDVCKFDRDGYRDSYNLCTADLISMTNDFSVANANYNSCSVSLVNASASGWSKCHKDITAEIDAGKKRSRRTIWIVIFVVFGLGVLIFLFIFAYFRSRRSVNFS